MKHYYFVKFSINGFSEYTYQGTFEISIGENDSYNYIFTQILLECVKIYKIAKNTRISIEDITIEVLTRIN